MLVSARVSFVGTAIMLCVTEAHGQPRRAHSFSLCMSVLTDQVFQLASLADEHRRRHLPEVSLTLVVWPLHACLKVGHLSEALRIQI